MALNGNLGNLLNCAVGISYRVAQREKVDGMVLVACDGLRV